MGIYFLIFHEPLGNEETHQAQFYVGWVKDWRGDTSAAIRSRLHDHRTGHGAAITRAANERGIEYDVVWCIPWRSRDFERRIKRQKNIKRFLEREIARTLDHYWKYKYPKRSVKTLREL